MGKNKRARVHPVGEAHPRAILTDRDVELRKEGYTWVWLAAKFEVGESTCRAICSGQRRGFATGISARTPWKVKKTQRT
jgi:hypothetical protein